MVEFRNLKKGSVSEKKSAADDSLAESELQFQEFLGEKKVDFNEGTKSISALNNSELDIEVLYNQACEYMQQALDSVRAKKRFSLEPGFEIMQKIVEVFSAKDQNFVKILPTGDPLKFVVSHSVNVAIYAIKMAVKLGFSENRQIEIGLSGMLHDIGMGIIPEEIIYKKESLTDKDFKIFQERPIYSYNILKSFGSEFGYLAEVALQVHERSDGSGYPRGLKNLDIHEYAQIIGLADIYEALIHSRPQREKYLHFVAVKEIIKTGKNQFHRKYLKVLLNVFSIFPVNSYVRLNSNAIGRIIETYPDQPMRPRIEIEFDSENRRVLSKRIVDLRENSLLYIADSLSEEELLEISAAAELVDRPGGAEPDVDNNTTLAEEDARPIGERIERETASIVKKGQTPKTGSFKILSVTAAIVILFTAGIIWQFVIKAPIQQENRKTTIKIKQTAATKVNNNKENAKKIKIPRSAVTIMPEEKISAKSGKEEPTIASNSKKDYASIESSHHERSPKGPDAPIDKQKKIKPLYPFSIQLASYKTRDAAETGRAVYSDMGISPYWVKVDLGSSGTWFRLFAGYFENLEQAEHAIKTYNLESVSAKKTEYSVLINSFSDINLLNSTREKLEKLGKSSYFIQWDNLYHLYVGAFFTIKGATDQCSDLNSQGFQCKVVKR